MNPNHLFSALKFAQLGRAQLQHAHSHSIESTQPFAEAAIFPLLSKAAELEQAISRLADAARAGAKPGVDTPPLPPNVIITVLGGVAGIAHVDEGLHVEVRNYDVDPCDFTPAEFEALPKDAAGDPYTQTIRPHVP
ncbi:MAG TPA: hypothetical protein VHH73_03305 [Verrucomicrobiae bacterium]|nr:hypothetical protein [Verrucomicrobiae bacterium]